MSKLLIYNRIYQNPSSHICKIVVDDFLPVSRDGTLMCTFSTNHEELWAPIIEKAVNNITQAQDTLYDQTCKY